MNTLKPAVLALVLAITLSVTASAQNVNGPVAEVGRTFTAEGDRTSGVLHFEAQAMIFASVSDAEAFFPPLMTSMERQFDVATLGGLEVVEPLTELAAPDVGNQRQAYTISLESQGQEFQSVILIVQTGIVIHTLIGTGLDNPSTEVFAVAEGGLADEANADDDESLLAVLPGLNDLPNGFVLQSDSERIERSVGSAREATPVGTPSVRD